MQFEVLLHHGLRGVALELPARVWEGKLGPSFLPQMILILKGRPVQVSACSAKLATLGL